MSRTRKDYNAWEGRTYAKKRRFSNLTKHIVIGPGGIDCPCCGEAPGKNRKKIFRIAKRKENESWKKELEDLDQ